MLEDPLRYILTTKDGLVNDYDNLPTNVSSTAEFNYENPFVQSQSAASNSLEWNQTYNSHAHLASANTNLDSHSNILPAVIRNSAVEYDDVIVPQANSFDKVLLILLPSHMMLLLNCN